MRNDNDRKSQTQMHRDSGGRGRQRFKKKIMDNLDREEPREGNWQFYCNQTSLAGEGWLLKISEYLMCPHG